jgi:hypothetical protein
LEKEVEKERKDKEEAKKEVEKVKKEKEEVKKKIKEEVASHIP